MPAKHRPWTNWYYPDGKTDLPYRPRIKSWRLHSRISRRKPLHYARWAANGRIRPHKVHQGGAANANEVDMNYVTVPSVAREKARRAKEDWIQRRTFQINMRMLELVKMWQSEEKIWAPEFGAYITVRHYTPSQKTMESLFDNWQKETE